MSMVMSEQDESLEALEERARKRWAREEDDREVALEELIEAMVPRERIPPDRAPEERTAEEFTCTTCRLIRSRSCLGDEARMICRECLAEERRAQEGTEVPRSRFTVEAPCPACGTVVMVPEREDAACGFFCHECGAHITRRGGRLHLEWDHRYRPDHLAVQRR